MQIRKRKKGKGGECIKGEKKVDGERGKGKRNQGYERDWPSGRRENEPGSEN